MVKGIYTAASGMRAQQWRLDSVANNLANLNTDSYKRELVSFKANPEMLLRRTNDDGVYRIPFGSADNAPIIGKLGTGVELNELFVDFSQGAFKETENDYDLALEGRGFFVVATPYGERYTRNGGFQLGKEGFLETKEGFPVLGQKGPIRIQANNFKVDREGSVWINAQYAEDPDQMIGREDNEWGQVVLLDTLRLVGFERERYLKKQGSSLYRADEFSGEPLELTEAGEPAGAGTRPQVFQGFNEAANVEPVREMVQMIEVNRSYEANQKIIQSHDSMLGTLINQYAKYNG
ncbi:MAG: flagellar basal-body rod protein FlgF [Treponema sp.]|jgi:flagellar basal-body rod protein FlgG|nr:flagellar basal-body rod protein FlgF [Treponema sp.]